MEHAGAEPNYLEPYREALRRHGAGFRATLWASEEAQRLRFDVMIDLVDFTGTTVLDVGCAHGEFAARLLERGVDFAGYIGIDALEPMIQAARERGLGQRNGHVRFETRDVLANPAALADERADWICFSGTLNTMEEAVARRLVSAAFDAAAQGAVFNFLSNRFHQRWSGQHLQPARRFDTVAWLDWALSHTSRVSFTQAYLDGHDATIVMAHD